jgi:hypothetical protein
VSTNENRPEATLFDRYRNCLIDTARRVVLSKAEQASMSAAQLVADASDLVARFESERTDRLVERLNKRSAAARSGEIIPGGPIAVTWRDLGLFMDPDVVLRGALAVYAAGGDDAKYEKAPIRSALSAMKKAAEEEALRADAKARVAANRRSLGTEPIEAHH